MGRKIRKKRNWYRGKVEQLLGRKSRECRSLVEEVRKTNQDLRLKLKKKYQRK